MGLSEERRAQLGVQNGWGAPPLSLPPGCRVTPSLPLRPPRRALRGERALRPLRPRRVQERGPLCEPAHRRLPLRVPPWCVREALLRGDHPELPAAVLRHLPGTEAALPLPRGPGVSPASPPVLEVGGRSRVSGWPSSPPSGRPGRRCLQDPVQIEDVAPDSRASPVAQLVKNPPATQETPVRFLGREDPLEKEKVTHSSILGLPW